MVDRDQPPKPEASASIPGRVCTRCGRTFLVGPILHTDEHPASHGGTSALCNSCLTRRSHARARFEGLGHTLAVLDFGYSLYWLAATIGILILALILRSVGWK